MSKLLAFSVIAMLSAVITIDRLQAQSSVHPKSVPSTRNSEDTAAQKSGGQDRRSLFNGKNLKPWSITQFGGQEDIRVENGTIVMEMGYPLVGITYGGEIPTDDYVLKLKAKKLEGTDFFCCVTFPVGDQFCSFVAGGWGGNITGISSVDSEDASQNQTKTIRKYELDQWYAFQISVADQRIRCWIDGELVVDLDHAKRELSLRPEVAASKPLGICSFETRAAFKDIFVEIIKREK